MRLPKCCGKQMEARIETTNFMEAWCSVCDDVVYIKKEEIGRPQLIDD